ncbi:MAG TPA: hypothetical protein VM656_02365, partial [Pyrinomonadaceae bacterium]|nr:hypothetical protein [Pyrinomonadaceae bacterium]
MLVSSFCKLSQLNFAKLANSILILLACRSVFTVKISLDQGRLDNWVEAGIPAKVILQALTTNAARLLGVEKE